MSERHKRDGYLSSGWTEAEPGLDLLERSVDDEVPGANSQTGVTTVPNDGPDTADALVWTDRRQSPAAAAIQRGVCRHFRALGFSVLTELPLSTGRRADVVGLSAKGEVWIAEIKSCLVDFRTDAKWPDYRDDCDRLFFAVAPDFPREVLPAETGLLLADRFGAEIARAAPEHRLPTRRRKALTLRFARAAALRLQLSQDPACALVL